MRLIPPFASRAQVATLWLASALFIGIRYDGVFLQQSTFFLSSLQQWKCIGPRRFERGAAIPKLRHVSGMLEWKKSGKPLGIGKLAKN